MSRLRPTSPLLSGAARHPAGRAVGTVAFGMILLASLAGCVTSTRFTKEEIPNRPEMLYAEVIRPAEVVGVVVAPQQGIAADTVDGKVYSRLVRGALPEVVMFDTAGGEVEVDDQSISGRTEDGSPFAQDFVDLLYLQVKQTDLAKQFISPLDLTCDREAAELDPRKKVKRGSSPCWDVVEFGGVGGKYDPASESVVGVTKNGTPIRVKVDEILHVRYWKRDMMKTARYGLATAGLFFFLNGAFHFWDAY